MVKAFTQDMSAMHWAQKVGERQGKLSVIAANSNHAACVSALRADWLHEMFQSSCVQAKQQIEHGLRSTPKTKGDKL